MKIKINNRWFKSIGANDKIKDTDVSFFGYTYPEYVGKFQRDCKWSVVFYRIMRPQPKPKTPKASVLRWMWKDREGPINDPFGDVAHKARPSSCGINRRWKVIRVRITEVAK